MGFEQCDMSWVLNSANVMGFQKYDMSMVLKGKYVKGFKHCDISRVFDNKVQIRNSWQVKMTKLTPPPFTCWTSASKSAVSLEPCLLASSCLSFLSTIWLFFCKMVAIGRKRSCIMSGVELAMIGCVRAKTNTVFVRILNVLINSWKNVQVEYLVKVIFHLKMWCVLLARRVI